MTTAVEQARLAPDGALSDTVALPQQLAAVRAALAPHLDRPGAARLLLLAVDLLLAGGGPCPWSLTDLTRRLGCARKSALLTLRLGEELGLLHRSPGPRVGDRRGPAPTAWALGVVVSPETGSATLPVRAPASASIGTTGDLAQPEARTPHGVGRPTGDPMPPDMALTGAASLPVSPRSGSEITVDDSEKLIRDLIQYATAQTQERQPARMTRLLWPLLTDLVNDGWTAPDLQALVADAIAATVAYRPVYPAAYLARVIAQRLATGRRPVPPVSRVTPESGHEDAPAKADPMLHDQPAHAIAALPQSPAPASAVVPAPRCRPRQLATAAPVTLPLPPATLWRAALDDVLARQPREAQYLTATTGIDCVGDEFVVHVPSAWVGARLVGRLRRPLEAALQVRAGQPLTLVCVMPAADELVALSVAV